MNARKIFNWIFYPIIFPVICLSYTLIPLTNDTRIYIGVEYIANTFYPLPQGWDLAWEIKPMANRIWNWMLYKVASAIVPFDNQIAFGMAVKAISLIVVIMVCWYFSRQIKNPYAFPLTFCAMTCLANFCIGQAEYWAVLFSLLAIGLMVNPSGKYIGAKYFIVGALFIIIALFKGITGLLLISIICGAILLDKQWGWDKFWCYVWNMVEGFGTAVIAFLICCWTIWPNAIPDMLMSAQVARVGEYSGWIYVLSETGYFFTLISYMPVLVFATILGIMYLIRLWYSDPMKKNIVLFVAMWATPFLIVFLQGEFFVYQYLVLMVPALVTLFLWDQPPSVGGGKGGGSES